MSKEMVFLYQLYVAFYKSGLKRINVSKESLKAFLPYLKSMIEEEQMKEIESLFVMNEDGIYDNYLEGVSSFDPLFAQREGNEVYIVADDNLSEMFNNDDVNYIGEKIAILRKIREKENVIYENN